MTQQKLTITGGLKSGGSDDGGGGGRGGGSGDGDEDEVAVGEDDLLSNMLASKTQQKNADDDMRERVAAEVDDMMDNGVKINPLLRQLYGSKTNG